MYSKEQCIKNIENREIDFFDLLKYILIKWKKILGLTLLMFGVMASVIYYKFKQESNMQVESRPQITMDQLSEDEKGKISSTLKLYDELNSLEDYKLNSSYMKLNPYESIVSTIQYFVSASDEKIESVAYELYLNFVEQGEFKEQLQKELGDQLNQPTDLVKRDNSFYIAGEGNDLEKKVLTLRINAPDENTSREISTIVKKSFNEYQYETVNKLVGKHELKLISESTYLELDDKVREKQEGIARSINEKRSQILALESQLSVEAKEVLSSKKNGVVLDKEESVSNIVTFPYKRLVLALLISAFVIIGAFSIYYFMNNKLKNEKEILRYFDISSIKIGKEKDREVIKKEIELLCQAKKIKTVYVSGIEKVEDKERFEEILCEIEGVEFIVGKSICDDVIAIDMARQCENVLFIAKPNVTSYNFIIDLLQKCNHLGVNVTGAIIE